MDLQTLIQALYYASIISILSMGVTLSYMTTRVFNFAHVRFSLISGYIVATLIFYIIASLGLKFDRQAYVAFERGEVSSFTPLPVWTYVLALIVAALVGGGVAVLQYAVLLKPLERRGADSLSLMISTLGFDFILVAALFTFATLPFTTQLSSEVRNVMGGVVSPDYTRLKLDTLDPKFRILGFELGLSVILALLFTLATAAGFWLLLNKTRLGLMMRSSIENPSLSLVLGINVDRVFAVTWFIAGAVAGLAGYLLVFNTKLLKPMTPTTPYNEIVVSVFAGSIVGGVNSVLGSIGGGLLIGLIEKLFVPLLQEATGLSLIMYDKAFSMLAVGLTLLFMPGGLASLFTPKYLGRLKPRIIFSRARQAGGGKA